MQEPRCRCRGRKIQVRVLAARKTGGEIQADDKEIRPRHRPKNYHKATWLRTLEEHRHDPDHRPLAVFLLEERVVALEDGVVALVESRVVDAVRLRRSPLEERGLDAHFREFDLRVDG